MFTYYYLKFGFPLQTKFIKFILKIYNRSKGALKSHI